MARATSRRQPVKTALNRQPVKAANIMALEILRDMVVSLQQEVAQLRHQIAILQEQQVLVPQIRIPFLQQLDTCIDGFAHEYPMIWDSTVPPPCRKCGKPAPPIIRPQITCSSSCDEQTLVVSENGITIT